MSTAGELIDVALKLAGVLGVGQIAQAEDLNDSLGALHRMLSQWNKLRYLTYVLQTYGFSVPGGQQAVTIGPAGDIPVAQRPSYIPSAYLRLPNGSTSPADLPIQVLSAREDYNRVTVKNVSGQPFVAYYEPDLPLGKLYLYPVPSMTYEVFVSFPVLLDTITGLTVDVGLPPEYEDAITYCLAERLCILFGRTVPSDVRRLAMSTLAVLRTANAQIATLQLPGGLRTGGVYDAYAGVFR